MQQNLILFNLATPILVLRSPVEALSDIEKQATQTANQGKNRLIGMEQYQLIKIYFNKI